MTSSPKASRLAAAGLFGSTARTTMWSASFTYIDKSQIVGCSLPVLHQLIGIEFRGVVIFSWDRFHFAPVTRLAEQFCCSFSDRGASWCGRPSSGDGSLERGLSTAGNTFSWSLRI